MEALLKQGLEQLKLTPPEGVVADMATYGALLIEQNKVMNLTAITEPSQVAGLHFLDSSAVLGCCDLKGKSLIDVGTGAGFPGMVLKLMEPSLSLTLADSLAKRLDWLDDVCDQLGIQDAQTVHCRAEELGHESDFREQYDVATARAVSDLRLLCELCLPFVKVGGHFLAMKATDCELEISTASNAIEVLGGRISTTYDYSIPNQNVERHVVVIEKIAPTPEKYPRRWAKIQKAPL